MNDTATRTSAWAALLLTLVVGLGGCASEKPADPRTAQTVTSTATPNPPATVGEPTRVRIPAIGVDEALHGVGLNADGSMTMPDFGEAGWYDLGPRPGAAGPAVLVAHVHSPSGPDVFWDLDELEPGDRVTVQRTDGVSTFVVDSSEQVRKEDLPQDRIWTKTDASVLRLITCGGEYDDRIGGYPDNTIVYAHLV